jgi:tetratricopeptide (TPR) repeat protein
VLPKALSRFGPYEVIDVIGRGASGVVYEAVDSTGRRVALKVLKEEVPAGTRARFQREIEVLRRLDHPSIVRILDAGTEGGADYFTMELLRGPTLAERIASRAPLAELVRHVVDVARALEVAHENGVIHRDVKPANVLLGADGHAKLSDFGLAQDLDARERLTASGSSMGTPAYMAPEQVVAAETDARTDVYALGAVLYEAIAGSPPFVRASLVELSRAIAAEDPEPPSRRSGASPALDGVCLRALAKIPDDRHATAAELADELERAVRELDSRSRRQLPARALGAGIALALLAVLSFRALVPRGETPREKTPAPRPGGSDDAALARPEAEKALERGRASFEAGQLAKAEDAFRAALADDPGNLAAWNGLAATLLDERRVEEATELLVGLTTEAPEFAMGWHNLARAFRERGRPGDAARAIERARRLEPASPEHEKEAGRVALAALQLKEAEAAFREAARLDPGDIEAAVSLASVLARLDRRDEARAELERVAAKNPSDARVESALRALDR